MNSHSGTQEDGGSTTVKRCILNLRNSGLYFGQLEGVIEESVGVGFYRLGLGVKRHISIYISLARTL